MAYKISTVFTATYDSLKNTIKSVKNEFKSVERSAESAKNTIKNTFKTANSDISKVSKAIKEQNKLISAGIKASVIGVATITVPTVLAGKSALKMAGQYESATQTLEYTLGEAKSIVDDFVEHNAQSIGMAQQDAYKFANIYSNLLTTMTDDQKTNAEYTNKLMQASAVIMSKTGRTFTDVADRIRSGLLGNTEAIEDLGVNVNVALLQTTDAFNKIANGRSWEKLSFQEQQQVRLLGILEQTTKKYGEEVGQNLSLDLARTSANFENVKTEASQFFATGLKPLLSGINNLLSGITVFVKYLNTLDDTTKQNITRFIIFIAVIPVVALVFLTLIKAINSYVIFTNIASASTVGLAKSMLGLLGTVFLLVAGIAMLAYAFGAFNNVGKTVKKSTNNTSNATKALNNLSVAQDNNADSAKKASDANKELADNLQSFDEINKLNLDSGSGSAGLDTSGVSSPSVDLSGIDTSAFDNISNDFDDLNQKVEDFKNGLEKAKPIIGIVGAALTAIGIGKLVGLVKSSLPVLGKVSAWFSGLIPKITTVDGAITTTTVNWAAIGSTISTVGSILIGIGAPIAAAIWGFKEVNKSIYEVRGATDIFQGLGKSVSDTTKNAVEPFINKIKDLNYTVASIDLISGIVTEKDVQTVKEQTSSIANDLRTNLLEKTKDISEQLNNVDLFPDPAKREQYLNLLNTSLNDEQSMIDYYESEINRIIETASNEKRELKDDEKKVINDLTRQMGESGIKILSENEKEALVLQAKFNQKYENLTKEQVVNAVSSAKELKDKTIQEAQDEYDEKVKIAATMKATIPSFTQEMYYEMIKDAKEQKDKQIKEAEETYQGIVNKVNENYPEVAKTIDFENGRALNSWEAFKKQSAIKWNEMKENTKTTVTDTIDGIKKKFNEFKEKFSPIKDWWNDKVKPWFTLEKWKNLGQGAVNGIKTAFNNMNLSFKLPHFSWTTEPATGWVSNILSALNLPTSIPKLHVNWYKKGGVFDSTSIIGVGEYTGARSNPEIVAPKSMIYDASIEAIKDSNENSLASNNSGSNTIRKKIELEIDLTSGGVKLGKKIIDLLMDTNDFYDLGLM